MMGKQNYLAYNGERKTIEWYFDIRGKKPAEEYFNDLDRERQLALLDLFKLMANRGEIKNIRKFRHEGDGVYAFKSPPDRFLCFFFDGSKIIVSNAFQKKSDKLLLNEKKKALSYKDDYTRRVNAGKYYE